MASTNDEVFVVLQDDPKRGPSVAGVFYRETSERLACELLVEYIKSRPEGNNSDILKVLKAIDSSQYRRALEIWNGDEHGKGGARPRGEPFYRVVPAVMNKLRREFINVPKKPTR